MTILGYEGWVGRINPVADRQHVNAMSHADFFVDGLLIGAGEDPSLYDDVSAVEPSSWARIKASF